MRHLSWFRPVLRNEEEEPTGGGPPDVPADPPATPDFGAQFNELKQMIGGLESRITELDEGQRFFLERSGGGEPKPEPPQDDDPTAFIEDINTRGQAAIDERIERILAERGVLTGDKFDSLANDKIQAATASQSVAQRYPDIANRNSEFYKTFEREFQALEGVPNAQRISKAAQLAELELRRTGKYREPETEESRIARIAAQSSSGRSALGSGRMNDEGELEMSDNQKRIARAMAPSDMSEEDAYKLYRSNKQVTVTRRTAGGGR